MKLTTDDSTKIDNPTWDEVCESIKRLQSIRGSFIILSTSTYNFIQATASNQNGFIIERRDGRKSKLWSTHRKDFSLEEVNEIFRHYYLGNSAWKSDLRWHFTTINTIPKWARITSKIGLVFSFVFLMILITLHKQFIGDNGNGVWLEPFMTLVFYSFTAASVDELFEQRSWSALTRRFFWPSAFLSLFFTIMMIVNWLK